MTRSFGTTRTLPSGKVQARYWGPDKRQRTVGSFDTLKAAKDALARVQADLSRDAWVDETKGAMTFGEFAPLALRHREQTLRAGTITNDRGHLRLRILPTFGHVALKDITKRRITIWLDTMDASVNVRRNAYTALSAYLSLAVEWEELAVKPTVRGAMRATAEAPKTYTLRDFQKLLDAAPEGFLPVLWTMLASHVRIGELRALLRSDVDLETGTVTISKQLRAQVVSPTKTGTTRTVVLLAPGLNALRDYLAKNPRLPMTPLFTTSRGKPINDSWFRRTWAKLREDSGLPNIRPHDLRHMGLSVAAQSGLSIEEVMQRGGHADIRSALHYMHSDDQRRREAALKVSAVLVEQLATGKKASRAESSQ
ncbi:integrase-like protein [Frondihabitans sp. PhB188]|uniref:tyrosine-type recombinase/integrase n=1 Tax=Frondihabitans sp. PhB188 TaxID=2485200 RepID=UPI000F49E1E5|nr:site-specific integrase [Frondihabitans sp. PhB188]ROQ40968.1 integrase-like protein [Frondihabitans sp. PhB188]